MKKWVHAVAWAAVLAVTAWAGLAAPAVAATATVDGVEWTYAVSGGTASIGSGTAWTPAIPGGTTGPVSIPATLGGYPVTDIGSNAFWACTGVSSVQFPASVTNIGEFAFGWCTGLRELTIPGTVRRVDYEAFFACTNLTDAVVENGVESFGSFVFFNCHALSRVTFPDSMSSAGYGTFEECGALSRLEVPGTWEGTGILATAGVPEGCEVSYREVVVSWKYTVSGGVATVTGAVPAAGMLEIPATLDGHPVTGIGTNAFWACEGLTGVEFPPGVTNIGDFAFGWCTGLKHLTVPGTVKGVGYEAFFACTGLEDAVFGEGVEWLGSYVFYGCDLLGNVSFPDSLASLGTRVFYQCPALSRLEVPASWKGSYLLWTANVPAGCEIAYREAAKAETATTPVAVPWEWLAGHGLGDGTEEGYEAAANAPAANGENAVWECWVLGLDPTDAGRVFRATLSFSGGKARVSCSPDLPAGRVFAVHGKKNLADVTEAWTPVADPGDAGAAGMRFFKVGAAMTE